MPPFAYVSRPNSFVPAIADLMLRPGQIEAQKAGLIADAESRAAMASGDAWGRAFTGVGNAAAGTITAMTDPRRTMDAIAVKTAQQRQAGTEAVDRLMRPYTPNGPQPEGDGPAPDQHPFLDDRGLYDVPKLTVALSANGFGHLAPDLLKGAELTNDAILKHQALQQKTEEAKAIVNGDMAHGVLTLMDKGVPFDKAFDFSASPGFSATGATPQQYVQLKQQLLALPPDQQRAALTRLMDQAAQLSPEKDLAEGAQRRDRYNRVQGTNEKPDSAPATFGIPQPDGTVQNVEGSYNKKTQEYSYQGKVVPNPVKDVTPPPAPVSQQVRVRMKLPGGVTSDVPVEFLPGRTAAEPGAYYFNQEDGTRRQVFPVKDFTEIPAASVTIHNDKDAKAANTRGELVDSLIRGDLPPSMLSRRADDYNATLADASKKYRELTGKPLSIAKLQLDYEAAKKFTASMNSGQMVRYRGLAESVVNTINEVERLGDTLQQGGVEKWNSVKRSTIRKVYGNTPESELANQYVGAVNTLKEEFANLANGGYAPTDAAWHFANDQINGDFGFKDLRASLTEVQRLINYRTQAFNEQHPYTGAPAGGGSAAAPIKVGGFTVVVK